MSEARSRGRGVTERRCNRERFSESLSKGKAPSRLMNRLGYRVDPKSMGASAVQYVDVTRAILETLADVHPRGIHAQALAALVSCEEAALSKELWLLKATGAVSASASASAEVRITDAVIRFLKRPDRSLG